jgi:hypothetical protein
MTATTEDRVVTIRRQWNSYDRGTVRLADLTGLHWSDVAGSRTNLRGRSPRPMVQGYVWCDAVAGLDYSHSCLHGEGPHRIKVCVVAKDNSREVMEHLRAAAGSRA